VKKLKIVLLIFKFFDIFLRKFFIFLITLYQKIISPFTPPSCIFEPTCSVYSKQAFKKYSFFKAFFLSVWRILRCNPFNKGGHDPLP